MREVPTRIEHGAAGFSRWMSIMAARGTGAVEHLPSGHPRPQVNVARLRRDVIPVHDGDLPTAHRHHDAAEERARSAILADIAVALLRRPLAAKAEAGGLVHDLHGVPAARLRGVVRQAGVVGCRIRAGVEAGEGLGRRPLRRRRGRCCGLLHEEARDKGGALLARGAWIPIHVNAGLAVTVHALDASAEALVRQLRVAVDL
mmetsp:Transcript_60000/g.176062  ORF Transcript_60000/g.176062 Transcript_60000/m.176062 type:complete len:202 (-) Transcript_60000:898-1503(-)